MCYIIRCTPFGVLCYNNLADALIRGIYAHVFAVHIIIAGKRYLRAIVYTNALDGVYLRMTLSK